MNIRKIESEQDIDNLKKGDIVEFAQLGQMIHKGVFDNLYLFIGRDNEEVMELWFERERLYPFKGKIGNRPNRCATIMTGNDILADPNSLYGHRLRELKGAGL